MLSFSFFSFDLVCVDCEIALYVLDLERKRNRNAPSGLQDRIFEIAVEPARAWLKTDNVIAARAALPLDELLERTLDGAGGVLFSCSRQGEDILSILEKMSLTETVSESERAAFVSALLTELVILLSSISCDKIVNTDDTLVPRVTRYINANIQGDLRLDAISGQFFVNKCYLCRAFKQQSGISIHTYINQKRVLMAKQLIESGEVASRAADAVGFGDYSALYRAYIKHLGVPPTSHQPKRGAVL
jgi:AraC-like DNA-binding protein